MQQSSIFIPEDTFTPFDTGLLRPEDCSLFQQMVWKRHSEYRRPFPWRDHIDPYHILVSEVMLQQTQTERVTKKFAEFIACMPTIYDLASAPKAILLSTWQGMGYNRRALWLQEAAQRICSEHDGRIPEIPAVLRTFKGIGPNTAGSICAFAFNLPTVFIETNIRTVFLHYYFPNQHAISDAQLLPLITQTVDHTAPREWYYALMDLGVALKKLHKNPSRRSAHYTQQSRFEGSDRQIRGAILRIMTEFHRISRQELMGLLPCDETRAERILQALVAEQFLTLNNDVILFR